MILKRFNNKSELKKNMATRIHHILNSAIEEYGDARMLLSGGSTPKFLYQELSKLSLDWSKVSVGLVDERFVSKESEFSNAKMIEDCFAQTKNFKLIPMVSRPDDAVLNLSEAKSSYAKFVERLDYCVLGMGEDGHTASLFPGDQASELSLKNSELTIIRTLAPTIPKERISCSKELLLKSHYIDLLIIGEKKLSIWKCAKLNDLPVAYFTNETKKCVTYFTESP
jgi:6-phosphogluconolactonase